MSGFRRFAPYILTGVLVISINGGIVLAEGKTAVSLTLSDALKTALEKNLDLKSSALDLKSSELSLSETQANDLQKPSPTSVLQAKTNLLVAQGTYDSAKSNLMVNLSDSYFGLVKANNLIKVNENALALSKDNLQVVESKLKAGVAAPLDEIKAQADVITNEANLSKAQNNALLAKLKLGQLIRLDPNLDIDLTTKPSYEPVSYDVEADIQRALSTRLELMQAKANIGIRETEVRLNSNDYTAAITLDKSKVSLDKAMISLDQTKDSIANEIRQNYINLTDAYSKIISSEKSLAAAKETLRVTQLRFKANMAVNSEVLDAQNSVTTNETNLEGAIFDYQISKYKYLRSVNTEYELK